MNGKPRMTTTRTLIGRSKTLLIALAAAPALALFASSARRPPDIDGITGASCRASRRDLPASLANAGGALLASADLAPISLGNPPPRMHAADNQVPPVSAADGRADQPNASASETELQALLARVAALEQQLRQSRTDPQIRLLQDADEQLAGVRQQLAEDQGRRDTEAAAARERMERRQAAIDTLYGANERLLTGDSDVLEPLEEAAPALPLPAQRAVQNARSAVDSEDLFTARYWISVAIAEAQRTQLGR
jgi:hypothetical protein